MKREDIIRVLKTLTYKPNWEIRWGFEPGFLGEDLLIVVVKLKTVCAVTGRPNIEVDMREAKSAQDFSDEKYLIRWLMDLIIRMETHEAMEWFKVDGVAPFYPHDRGERSA